MSNMFHFAPFLLFYCHYQFLPELCQSLLPTFMCPSIYPPHRSQPELPEYRGKVQTSRRGFIRLLYSLISSCFPGFILYHCYTYTHPTYRMCVLPHTHTLDLSHTQLSAGPQEQQLPLKPLHLLLSPTGLLSPLPLTFLLSLILKSHFKSCILCNTFFVQFLPS